MTEQARDGRTRGGAARFSDGTSGLIEPYRLTYTRPVSSPQATYSVLLAHGLQEMNANTMQGKSPAVAQAVTAAFVSNPVIHAVTR